MKSQKAFAPGRIELLGNHTDYNEGFVLSTAIQFGVSVNGVCSGTSEIRVSSLGKTVHASLDSLAPRKGEESWANYVLGVASILQKAGYPIGGFNIALESTLPIGAGLSSSAAVEVSTAKLLTKLFGLAIDPLALAKLCRKAENEFVGVNCGLLDQVSSVFGKKDHVVYLDCRSESIERVPFPAHLSLLITHSGVAHALVGGEYNERREQCFQAASLLGVHALRDVNSEQLRTAQSKLPEIVYRRASHIIGENERVQNGVRDLQAGDGKAFGARMFASHESSRVHFENSTPELDMLVQQARTLPGVLGARLTGGGFGGATVTLVESEKAAEVAEMLAILYRKETGNVAKSYLCHASDGAC